MSAASGTALIAGAAKVDRSKLEAAALSDGGLHACQANRAADEKEVAITYGMLRDSYRRRAEDGLLRVG